MLNVKEYLPIGSVVLLSGGRKKVMIIGIMPSQPGETMPMDGYDYIGVTYPEGFLDVNNLLLISHSNISDVICRGYENAEREDFINKLGENITKYKEQPAAESEDLPDTKDESEE